MTEISAIRLPCAPKMTWWWCGSIFWAQNMGAIGWNGVYGKSDTSRTSTQPNGKLRQRSNPTGDEWLPDLDLERARRRRR